MHGFHLLIPGAAFLDARGQPCAFALTPNLRSMLREMQPADAVALDAASPAMPWEVAHARALGLPSEPGRIPWAAFELRTVGEPCAWLHPCHWSVGREGVRMDDPSSLQLSEEESRALLAAAAPWFMEDGIALEYREPGRWLAKGDVFRDLAAASLGRVIGRDVHASQFEGEAGRVLARLQNEMQMLFYTHPVNEARERAGRVTVNSFWITGAGVIDAMPSTAEQLVVEKRLLPAALRRDADAHAKAWAEVDADACASLLARLRQGEPVRLTLAGERAAQTFEPAAGSAWQRFQRRIGLRSAPALDLLL